jgi:hypothetical protein
MTVHAQRWPRIMLTVGWVALLALFFAQTEIQIEGAAGWAAALPTWRIEHHWLLDLFWGGRPMTGYHAWCFRSSRCFSIFRCCSCNWVSLFGAALLLWLSYKRKRT